MKKSEVYKAFMIEFLTYQKSDNRRLRFEALERVEDLDGKLSIVEQSAVESTVEILLNVLCKIGLLENDCSISVKERKNQMLEAAANIANSK